MRNFYPAQLLSIAKMVLSVQDRRSAVLRHSTKSTTGLNKPLGTSRQDTKGLQFGPLQRSPGKALLWPGKIGQEWRAPAACGPRRPRRRGRRGCPRRRPPPPGWAGRWPAASLSGLRAADRQGCVVEVGYNKVKNRFELECSHDIPPLARIGDRHGRQAWLLSSNAPQSPSDRRMSGEGCCESGCSIHVGEDRGHAPLRGRRPLTSRTDSPRLAALSFSACFAIRSAAKSSTLTVATADLSAPLPCRFHS